MCPMPYVIWRGYPLELRNGSSNEPKRLRRSVCVFWGCGVCVGGYSLVQSRGLCTSSPVPHASPDGHGVSLSKTHQGRQSQNKVNSFYYKSQIS